MRLRNALALGVTAATTGTAVLALAVAPSSADPAPAPGLRSDPNPRPAPTPDPATEAQTKPPTCGKATDPVFPLDTRIQSGSGTYVPGAGFQSFEVELTNTTAEPCHSIHPVLVLADRDRVLRPAQIRLDFYDSEASRWRPVQFEETDEDENIGVFNGFPGFAVPAGRTVTVGVRLAFHEGTAPNEVVANAAIVQRRGDDGDWVGESDDYRLTIAPEGTTGTDTDTGTGTGTETSPSPVPSASAGETVRPPAPARPELALTGPESTTTLAPASGALLLTGGALVAAARRGRRRA